tara:strand:- start:12921 stop:13766 length:846 start_codon:yes stop_codon:yes gene_type:complete
LRISSFILRDGTTTYGAVSGDGLIVADDALRSRYPDLKALIAAGAIHELADATGDTVALTEVEMLPPIAKPDKIICIGLNYLGHIKETGRDRPEYPSIFTRFPASLVGHDQPMIRPAVSDMFDYEGEFAIVIGKPGRAIAKGKAFDHVAGYTCFNDGSIRDFQRHTSQFWGGKNFDRSGSMGPWLVTPDELGDPTKPTMVTRLNGEVMQETSVGDLAFQIPDLISYISTITELVPGDIIATGTPGGVGLFRDPKVFMKPGDRIEVEISGIGTLRNVIAEEH